jgi:hypothetical protein
MWWGIRRRIIVELDHFNFWNWYIPLRSCGDDASLYVWGGKEVILQKGP